MGLSYARDEQEGIKPCRGELEGAEPQGAESWKSFEVRGSPVLLDSSQVVAWSIHKAPAQWVAGLVPGGPGSGETPCTGLSSVSFVPVRDDEC